MKISNRSKVRLTKIAKVTLYAIGVVGVLSLAVVAPNATLVLKLFEDREKRKVKSKREKSKREYDLKRGIEKKIKLLKSKGFVTVTEKKGERFVGLTEEGRRTFAHIQLGLTGIRIPLKWDGKFRVIVFDIPESQRHKRDLLRSGLKNLGFAMIQQSVWITPFECKEAVELIREAYQLEDGLVYIKNAEVENIEHWIEYFGLKSG